MRYRKGFKYQLAEDERYDTGILGYSFESGFLSLEKDGYLLVRAGYAWDGATGAIDTPAIIAGSLPHDALYQISRNGVFDKDFKVVRKQIDRFFIEVCMDKGMWRIRAWYVLKAVRKVAAFAADPKNKLKVLEI